jgi:hypothetical protein
MVTTTSHKTKTLAGRRAEPPQEGASRAEPPQKILNQQLQKGAATKGEIRSLFEG